MKLIRKAAMLLAATGALAAAANPPLSLADQQLKKLAGVHRLYVEELVGEGAHAIRDLLAAAIHARGLFVLVEDPAMADAYMRGSAEDLIYTDYERYRSGINVRGAASSSQRESGDSNYGSASFGVGDTEDSNRRERRHEALAAVRIVLNNGEVVWAAARESNGAKFRGAAADVAHGVAEELETAVLKAQSLAQKPD
jgi:hypothetical protein